MKNWFKYSLSKIASKVDVKPKDSLFSEHAETMGGYEPDDAYNSVKAFFGRFYYNYQLGRLENYDSFLREHLEKKDKILSIASGRSANELKLLDDGYDIYCTDLDMLPSYDATTKLFPKYRFSVLNILEKPTDTLFDSAISLGLIYLFDNKQLDSFFRNISNSLTGQGYLLLDGAGSPDNFLSFLIHDVVLKIECHIFKLLTFLKSGGKKNFGVVKKMHGYRRTNIEIVEIANSNGFKLIGVNNYAFLHEFSRSAALSILLKIPLFETIFRRIGKNVPFIRMFYFQKI